MFKPPLTYEDGRIIREIANFQARRVGGDDFVQGMAAGGGGRGKQRHPGAFKGNKGRPPAECATRRIFG